MEGMHHLPQDIVFDIFVRLPTKALLRLRCLSKHWNRLISDEFMKSRSRRMILLSFKPLHAIDNTVHSVVSLRSHFKNQENYDHHVIIVGTFNGIVFLVCKDMILYNPLTGAFKIVPDPPFRSNYGFNDSYVHGFCYGTTTDDLKIVRLTNGTGFYQAACFGDVSSLKEGSWRTKSKTMVRNCLIKQYAGTFVNGFLYWIAISEHGGLVVALNVKKMVFSEIELPFFQRLQVLHVTDVYNRLELWVMNEEHGMEKTWSKVLTSNVVADFNIPLSIIDVGKIVLKDRSEVQVIYIYDMLKDSYEVYRVTPNCGGSWLWRIQAMEYVESLISPSDLCSSW
ncbi:hypothetical protein L1987_76327 [Smallanthus sonchifolius]|uniref:Uncharacterized protein n=1 Tax=Smallanthus sonchifolius TaxID=185202 RepID=A0ACB9A8V4_9ASTR|nr:hypothetical protein L1987_76327 [Smallanthus sonchifolius]